MRSAIFPDWWDNAYQQEPRLLQDIEIRVARFLGLPLSVVKDPSAKLTAPTYPEAKLRRVRNINCDKLGPAIHSAMRIAAAVVRTLRTSSTMVNAPPADGQVWRSQIQRPLFTVTLSDIAGDLWQRGIPVIPLDVLPIPNFQGIAAIVGGRPVILLGHKHEEPGRVAFVVAHEAGHIAASDCAPNQPVVDEEEDILDDSYIERRADQYANHVLIGNDAIPNIIGTSFKELARQASKLERETGADASAMIFAWARRTGGSNSYQNAALAVKALYRGTGARRQLRLLFDQFVDLETATETDRALLRCIYGEPELHEAAS